METRTQQQLEKVLALADSSHDGEAIVAVRKARQMLTRNGLSFSDLARAASGRVRPHLPFSFFASPPEHLEMEILNLRQQLADAEAETDNERTQAEFWRRRAAELEQTLVKSMGEASRWRTLARETVEKLWDLGQNLQAEEFQTDPINQQTPSTTTQPRKTA